MKEPLISIVMPAYNCETTVTDAVESVKAQTYENWELIIVEDCSTDHTFSVVENLTGDKIRVYRNNVNSGVALTRNRGIEESKGEYIAFLDSDDLWVKNKLEKQVKLMDRVEDPSLLFTGSAFITQEGVRLDHILHVPEEIDFDTLLKQNLISCSSAMVKSEIMKEHLFPQEKDIHEDFVVWLEILEEIPYAYGIDEPLLIYRLSENGKSHNKLHAAKMNWNVYEYIGLPFFKSVSSMVSYTINGLKKYSKL